MYLAMVDLIQIDNKYDQLNILREKPFLDSPDHLVQFLMICLPHWNHFLLSNIQTS